MVDTGKKCKLAAGLSLMGLLLTTLPARANDSSVAMAAGGLVPRQSNAVTMAAEDLYISPSEIRIRYEFRNAGSSDETTIVGFPLPDLKLEELFEVPVDYPAPGMGNFVDFTITVDGRPIQPQAEVKAIHKGNDVTAFLERYSVPLNGADQGYGITLGRLPKATHKALAAAGLAEDVDDQMLPHWTQRTTFYWTQTFPAGRTVVIEHRYKPVVGFNWLAPDDMTRKAPDPETGSKPLGLDYCITGATAETVKARFQAQQAKDKDAFPVLRTQVLDYILTTARTWKGPIGTFRLIIETGSPDVLLATCLPGLRKTGPSRHVLEAADYVPPRDLAALFILPQGAEESIVDVAAAAYLMPDSSTRKLTAKDLAGRSKGELRLIRNEIYARHGFIFNSEDLRIFFSRKDWYKPLTRTVTLSPIEQANVTLIQSLEK